MNPGESMPRLIRLADFARSISVSVRTLYRMIDDKEVPSPIKQGRGSFFLREDLDSYFEKLKQQRK